MYCKSFQTSPQFSVAYRKKKMNIYLLSKYKQDTSHMSAHVHFGW